MVSAELLDALARLVDKSLVVVNRSEPRETRYQLLETMRTHASAPFVAVALTAYATLSDRERTLRSGFQAHVSKPVELPQLLSTVAALLDRHSWKP